ncbi:hypothetical protein I551_4392 [Mycobacterium ulcerans str. Harvey]|uniref:Uncharacterized protein n=1 Tax=Mycobacterium ulcerans str. Harvey TaxID=1299332 RepID=A0ABN0QWQ2_MYCUL|nr:hypothetical protein I551_4392 [Mycobacterium ulcerans str. Harvey]
MSSGRVGQDLAGGELVTRFEGPNRCSPAEPLSRSWMMSTPPARAASAKSARSPRSRRASVHR